jgi:hypothetical protein
MSTSECSLCFKTNTLVVADNVNVCFSCAASIGVLILRDPLTAAAIWKCSDAFKVPNFFRNESTNEAWFGSDSNKRYGEAHAQLAETYARSNMFDDALIEAGITLCTKGGTIGWAQAIAIVCSLDNQRHGTLKGLRNAILSSSAGSSFN